MLGDENFGQNKRAALLSSKIAYSLGDYDTVLYFALKAGDLFELAPSLASGDRDSQDTLVRKLI